ncbi:ABC transporter permease subunit/CPBP intramembrane protease [Pyxidicoccus xibeiensis]|uniref:ABC transporter permease subunit/CPBP intramembrane protease n=1 Tax=Pyxidicoccus xibeiensis TaxID=2906759 RepID=UPI0020A7DB6F|nr:ABC transporter permease subunit/CPBP intramembrane protease [Pyxidicoccus xibeiensis]MCP3140634.1 CPBP family glutamic-type intramembrane protease [Pyxidicoccus xibeiensis]
MRLSTAYTILRRDVRESLRDKRTLLLLVLVPMLLYPLLMAGAAALTGSYKHKLEAEPLQLAVWGPVPASFLASLEQHERVTWVERRDEAPSQPEPEARARFEGKEVQAVLVVHRASAPGAEDNLDVRLIFDSSRPASSHARRRLETALQQTATVSLRERLATAALPPALAEPVKLTAQDVKAPGAMLAWALPYLLLSMMVLAGFYPALDVTAGEKERGTLQTLLCAPVTPLEVVAGKYGAVLLFTIGGTLANLAALGLTFLLLGGAEGVSVNPTALAGAFAALVPLAMLVAALLLAVGVMARNFKEGQNLLMPVLLAVMMAGMASQLPSIQLTAGMALVPILNVALLLRELLTATVNASVFSLVLVSSAAWSVVGILFAARVFESEQVLLSGEKPWRDVFGRKVRRGDHLSPGGALLFCAVAMVLYLFAAVLLMKHLPMWGLLIVLQVGGFLGLAVLWAWRSGADLREVFWLRLPSGRGLLAVLMLAPGVLGLQSLLRRVLETSWVPGTEEFLRGLQSVMEQSNRWPLPLALTVLALVPALCEEAAFRGVVLTGLSRTGSRVVAVVGSALAFGLVHIHPAHVLLAGVVGLVLGHATLRTGSMLAGVLLHLFNNGVSVLLSRAGSTPAWLESWPGTVALCGVGVMGLWVLRGMSGPALRQAPTPLAGNVAPQQG